MAHSAETRAKIAAALKGRAKTPEHRAALKGRVVTEETRAKISATQKAQGRKLSPEAAARLHAASRGRVVTEETRAKLAAVGQGRVVSEETRALLRELNKDFKLTPEHQAKLVAANTGRPRSPETRAKISATLLGRFDGTWLETPDGVDWVRSSSDVSYHKTRIRKQDGDLCQLCLDLIDFTLHWSDLDSRPDYPSVDHIVPRRAGGTDDMGNLWLAHLSCNMAKSCTYIGRSDGTTDRRTLPVEC